ncbi:MAG TPA: outer membrane beta-barrel protein [Candidatus Polarisedimenticolaceae bacterium]|nr:outer membrane beta-barrel protein [Candidatus Polarisedimenticolaceae bacterium]
MRKVPVTPLVLVLLAVVCSTARLSPALAADSERAERWQFQIPITFTSSETFDGEADSFLEVSDDVGWGFGFGYHANERLYVGFDLTFIQASYDASVEFDLDNDMVSDGTVTLGGTLDASAAQFAGQYNFLDNTITPFVRGNFGWTYIDSNIPSGPTEGVCWWDPWWGYVCDTWQPTYDDTSFSYGLGVGVRADVSQSFFLDLSYNQFWIDLSESTPSFNGVRLNFGWMF